MDFLRMNSPRAIVFFLSLLGVVFAEDSFLKIVDGRMVKDGKPYYRVGYCLYNAFILGITNEGKPWMKKGSPWWNAAYLDESLAEAKKERIPILRVSMTPFWPKSMLLWLENPDEYWRQHDAVMKKVLDTGADIIAVGHWLNTLFLYLGEMQKAIKPPYDEYVPYQVRYKDMVDKNHAGWKLTERYYRELISRYKNNPQIVAWEFPNELNLLADVPHRAPPGAAVYAPTNEEGLFTTDMLIEYSKNLAELIASLDSKHLVFTGNATPRPGAWHLWKKGNFDRDSTSELEAYLKGVHEIPGLSAWSIHFYNDKSKGVPDSERFGYTGAGLLKEYSRIAKEVLRKPLIIGEFGDTVPSIIEQNGEAVFISQVLEESFSLRVPITLLWAWYPSLTSKDQDIRRLERFPKVRAMAKEYQARFDQLKD